ncbi:unnamed protein product [Clavelina lepadiformis]|uniref:Nuclear envelope integral membrane protein 1 n=1 Tax=Clavelina lepadiformis TaxID=159417 RepID=A0ABP0FY84_CLALP
MTLTYLHFLIYVLVISPAYATDNLSQIQLDRNGLKLEHIKPSKTVYHVPALTNPFFVLGCVHISVTHAGSFDINFLTSLDDTYNQSIRRQWYDSFQVLSRWFTANNIKSINTYKVCLSPYKEIYFTVKPHIPTESAYVQVKTNLKVVDLTCCLCLCVGLILFYNAAKLSQSAYFHYASGTGVGVLASALVIVFLVSKFMPKKPAAYSILLGGWSLCAWIISKIYANLVEIMIDYYHYVFAYVLISGLVSFAICYRFGTITDHRTQSIIQWSIQLLSLLLIYNGTQIPQVSLSIMCALLMSRSLLSLQSMRTKRPSSFLKNLKKIRPFSWILRGHNNQLSKRLLTAEEYRLQGQVETQKALEELRKYCQSPQCSPWKTLSRMESPKRFAQFIDSDIHLLDSEITQYDNDMHQFTDDSDNSVEYAKNAAGDSLISEDEDSIESLKLEIDEMKEDGEPFEEEMSFDEL